MGQYLAGRVMYMVERIALLYCLLWLGVCDVRWRAVSEAWGFELEEENVFVKLSLLFVCVCVMLLMGRCHK